MRNEMIVSSFIYVSLVRKTLTMPHTVSQYYDSENISESRLAFRRATSEPPAHEQDDGKCMRVLLIWTGRFERFQLRQ